MIFSFCHGRNPLYFLVFSSFAHGWNICTNGGAGLEELICQNRLSVIAFKLVADFYDPQSEGFRFCKQRAVHEKHLPDRSFGPIPSSLFLLPFQKSERADEGKVKREEGADKNPPRSRAEDFW